MAIPGPETVAKIRLLQKHLLEEPRRFNLNLWGVKYTEDATTDDFKSYVLWDAVNQIIEANPPCRTIACLAGGCLIIGELVKPEFVNGAKVYMFSNDAPIQAAKWLGITTIEATKLFFLKNWSDRIFDPETKTYRKYGWPAEFASRLETLEPGSPEYAQVGVDRLEYYINIGE